MEQYLEHHGVLGQKWGVRRYQNADGSYTEAGKKRHAADEGGSSNKKAIKRTAKAEKAAAKNKSKMEKVDKYRQKLANKSAAKAEKEKDLAKQSKKEFNDLRSKGIYSETYKKWQRDEIKKAQRAYEYENKDKEKGTYDYGDLFKGGSGRALEIAMTHKKNLSELMGQKIYEQDMHNNYAKNWTAKNEHFMNMKITDAKVSKLNLAMDYYFKQFK